jgi:Fur family peroxide stress response transcriptional regulator
MDERQDRLNQFKEGLRRSGVKLTNQRLEICLEIARAENHPDAEQVYKGVRERIPGISLDTVYRTLWLLLEMGLINSLGTPRDRIRFDGNIAPHHHFVCTKCGAAYDFYSRDFDQLQVPEEVQTYGIVQKTQVEVKGVCRQCSKTIEK